MTKGNKTVTYSADKLVEYEGKFYTGDDLRRLFDLEEKSPEIKSPARTELKSYAMTDKPIFIYDSLSASQITPPRGVTTAELQKDYPMSYKHSKHADGHPARLQDKR